jgi:pimeloyl-ACP methyl ester carboxylesterase
MNSIHGKIAKTHGYAPVNGLKIYYEIEGNGEPLIYIPPVFGYAGLKSFAALIENHSVITPDLQGHGRTTDIPDRPMTLEQNARDVVGLLKHLGIPKADFFGESYGGVIATMIAVHHPELVGRVATFGATFGPPQVALNMEMLRMSVPLTPESGAFQFQKESYKKVAPDPDYWPTFWAKVCAIQWGGFSDKELASIEAPLLIVLGDHDFVRLEHSVETLKRIPSAELAVIPNAGHFALFSESQRVIPVVADFLNRPAKRIPIATAESGYHPGKTR